MLKVRIIPTLLTDGFGLVKGERFDSWRTVGALMPAVRVFNRRDVDELVILDVRARAERRPCDPVLIEEIAGEVRVPLSVGGGISDLDDIDRVLGAGADKVILNSAAYDDPALVNRSAGRYGSQCIVVAIDVAETDGGLRCVARSGSTPTAWSPEEWAREVAERGAGEILVTRTELDGTLEGYDLHLVAEVSAAVDVPVIAAGGAGSYEHLLAGVRAGASAVAAGAMFQFTHQTPAEARDHLGSHGVPVRRSIEQARLGRG